MTPKRTGLVVEKARVSKPAPCPTAQDQIDWSKSNVTIIRSKVLDISGARRPIDQRKATS